MRAFLSHTALPLGDLTGGDLTTSAGLSPLLLLLLQLLGDFTLNENWEVSLLGDLTGDVADLTGDVGDVTDLVGDVGDVTDLDGDVGEVGDLASPLVCVRYSNLETFLTKSASSKLSLYFSSGPCCCRGVNLLVARGL